MRVAAIYDIHRRPAPFRHRFEEFAAKNVLQPPSEQEMLEAFSKAEIK